MHIFVLLVGLFFLPVGVLAQTFIGDGSPQSCTTEAIQAALDQGGAIQFRCGDSPHRIVLTAPLKINLDTQLDGGGLISLDGQNRYRILRTKDVDPTNPALVGLNIEVRNLRFLNGKAVGDDEGSGGAIRVGYRGNMLVSNCYFEGNDGTVGNSERGGGAIALYSFSAMRVEDSEFVNNHGINGGGINSIWSNLVIERTRFTGNTATTYAGAIYTDGASDRTKLDQVGTVTIIDSHFEDNQGFGQGGAVFSYVYPPDYVLVERTAFFNNSVGTNDAGHSIGGGLRHGNGRLILRDSVFVGNTSRRQGGGLWMGENSGDSLIYNTTFYRNRSVNDSETGYGGVGGAMAAGLRGGSIMLDHVTMVENHAGHVSGAFYGDGVKDFTIRNSIIAHNTAFNSGNNWNQHRNCSEEMKDGGNNIQFPAKSTTNRVDSDCTDSVRIIDPLMGEFITRDNATATLTLQANSPAIDAAGSNCPLLDQRGAIRPQGAGCDIGAFEYNPNDDQSFSVNTGQTITLADHHFAWRLNRAVGKTGALDADEPVGIEIRWSPNQQHQAQAGGLVLVAAYAGQLFIRDGLTWRSWDSDMRNLALAASMPTLGTSQVTEVYSGNFSAFSEPVALYAGYVTADSAELIYSLQPLLIVTR